MVGQSNVWYYLVMLISTCSQMYRAVVITASANVRWAYRSVLQTFMAFSVMQAYTCRARGLFTCCSVLRHCQC